MNILQAIILSIVEGLTEFIPVSSTGHLIIVQHFLKIPVTEFTKSFEIIIQLAAILAVTWNFRQKIFASTKLWPNIIYAFLPTGIIGFVLYKLIKAYLLGNTLVTTFSLFLGGIVLLLFDRFYSETKKDTSITNLSPIKSASIGLFQTLSVIPGVSRSAASIIGGLLAGLSRKDAVEFSFLLAIPTMLAASGYDLLKSGLLFSSQEYVILAIGCIFSFTSSMIAVRFFMNFIKTHNFTFFGIYRIIISIIIFIFLSQ